MNCVNCQEPMIVLELDQIEIDYCVACGGIWLDAGELELLLGDAGELEEIVAEPLSSGERVPAGRKCPICLKAMEELRAGEDANLYIDVCRRGHGLWFDKGELRGLLRIFRSDRGNQVVRLLEEIFSAASKGKEE